MDSLAHKFTLRAFQGPFRDYRVFTSLAQPTLRKGSGNSPALDLCTGIHTTSHYIMNNLCECLLLAILVPCECLEPRCGVTQLVDARVTRPFSSPTHNKKGVGGYARLGFYSPCLSPRVIIQVKQSYCQDVSPAWPAR